MRLMQRIRDSIKNECFPEFAKNYVINFYSSQNENSKETHDSDDSELPHNNDKKENNNVPEWVVNALKSVNIHIFDD